LRISGEINGQAVAMEWGNLHGKEVYPLMKVDPTVELTSGKNLGKAEHIHFWGDLNSPLCIVNGYGKGRAILLNFAIYDAPAEDFIKQLLAAAGVCADISLSGPDGEGVQDVEITRWRDGDTELLALLGTREGEVNITLPEARFVYDLKAGQALGQRTEFTYALRPNRAAFFALFPKAGSGPEIRVVHPTVAPGTVVNARISVPGANGKHMVRLEATTPSGERADWFDQSVVVANTQEVVSLPFAHNDPTGTWTIRAIDLLTNDVATATVTLD
jgi:hypothetical protein